MNRDDLALYLALDLCTGVGSKTYQQILDIEGIVLKEFFELSQSELSAFGLNQTQVGAIINPPWQQVDMALEWMDSDPNHHIINITQQDYPKLLKEISDPPPVLYAKGRAELLDSPQIAIVGSRNCTPGGASNAREFAAYLARSGLTITSGMALGIDQHAHQGALEASGNTIAVTGTGIDRIYPSRNKQLAYQIAEQGLLISEFPLGTSPHSSNFPKRNRVISGLSLATLVVEATRKSGSLITARLGMEQGREVFAIPGSIHNPQSKGCHHLIRQGVKLVDQASDIIDDIGSLLGYMAEQVTASETRSDRQLDHDYEQLLDLMGYDPISMDTLVERSGLTIDQLSSMLLLLELNDFIQPAPGGLFVRR